MSVIAGTVLVLGVVRSFLKYNSLSMLNPLAVPQNTFCRQLHSHTQERQWVSLRISSIPSSPSSGSSCLSYPSTGTSKVCAIVPVPVVVAYSLRIMMYGTAWNVGTCLFMIWTGLGCLIQCINSIVWNNNMIDKAPVYCDIGNPLAQSIVPQRLTLILQQFVFKSGLMLLSLLAHCVSTVASIRLLLQKLR
jgi:Pheromone A receptor